MCDASNSVLRAVSGQKAKVGNQAHELLAIVFTLDKFRSYLLGSKIIVFSDHAALRFLLKKSDAKLRLIRWMLLLQEFNIKIKDKKGVENFVADHLSKIERDITAANEYVYTMFPPKASRLYKGKLKSDAKYYIWDDPYLWRLCNDQFIRKCISDSEINLVLQFCHATSRGSHYGLTQTT
ncbi:Retrovirus-related Pol polyprotein from transposon 17.6, partial [Mucuna pruriens]